MTTTKNPILGMLRNAAIRFTSETVMVRARAKAGADPHRELREFGRFASTPPAYAPAGVDEE